MNAEKLLELKQQIEELGYGMELVWAENIKLCEDTEHFLWEYIWVVIHSGIKHEIARKIEAKVKSAIDTRTPIKEVFKHPGKSDAIQKAVDNIDTYFNNFLEADDKLAYLETLPWVGKITKYHLAKNLGLNVAKPDRHLERIAAKDGRPCQQLCSDLAKETGLRVATVDQILWRAALLELL